MSRKERELRNELVKRFPGLSHLSDGQEDHEQSASVRPRNIRLLRSQMKPALFPYQKDLVTQTMRFVRSGRSGLLSLPTGGGKTRTASVAVLTLLKEHRRVVWLAPTIELVDQALETFSQMWKQLPEAPDLLLTRAVPGSWEEPLVWVTTPHAINVALQDRVTLGRWSLIVFDEAHQLEAPTFKRAAEALQTSGRDPKEPRAPLIGLSATPGRVDQDEARSLINWFGGHLITSESLGKNPIRTLQQDGVLARLKFRRLTEKTIPPQAEADRIEVGARACYSLAQRGGRVLVFTASVAGAHLLSQILTLRGVRAAAVDGKTDPVVRDRRLRDFSEGQIQVLCNMRLLSTGYDCPAVSDCILLTPVGSPILFEQMVGRAARGPRTGGWGRATIWEFDDHLAIHGLPQSYYRYPEWQVLGDRLPSQVGNLGKRT